MLTIFGLLCIASRPICDVAGVEAAGWDAAEVHSADEDYTSGSEYEESEEEEFSAANYAAAEAAAAALLAEEERQKEAEAEKAAKAAAKRAKKKQVECPAHLIRDTLL